MTGSVYAVSMMRNEADVAEHVVRHLVEEAVDGIIVADNMSDDATRAMLDRAAERWSDRCNIVIVNDEEVGYYQSRKMTALARRAHDDFGAEWIIPFDADEIWYSRTTNRLAETLRALPIEVKAVNATLFNHFQTSIDKKADVPFEAMEWRQRQPGALPKVAFRWADTAVILQGNHAVAGVQAPVNADVELRHFPYRSFEHFVRKARAGAEAYAATTLPETEGAHWRSYGRILENLGEAGLREVYDRYFNFLSPVDEGMVLDPAPFLRWSRQ